MEYDNSESRAKRARDFADIHAQVRIQAKKSQDYMAMALGVSKKTIQNWEKGISSPTFFQSLEWFKVLSINPLPYYCKLATPNMNVGVSNYSSDEEVNKAFEELSKNISTSSKRAILYVFLGKHGSSPIGLLQLALAYLHLPLKSRASHTSHLLHDYDTELNLNNLCDDKELPDIEVLMHAFTQANKAILKQLRSYYDLTED